MRRASLDMKLSILVAITLLLVYTQHVDSKYSWLPQAILQTVTNKTSFITDYVKEKGRNFKKFYVENVRSKFFGPNQTNDVRLEVTQKPNQKVREYNEKTTGYFEEFTPPPDVEQDYKFEDPIDHMTTPQLIAIHGYPAESHTIVTDDGYILTVHRIPFPKDSVKTSTARKTVLLHHGLLGSSADWIIAGPGKGLAYILSDAGYDVWMANVRGNTYSRAHISRPIDSFAFWNFTFHEVSQHDLPAVIDYIMELKGWDVKINYIGHSMGTTVLFALLSTKTQYNKVLRAGFALAPVAYMTDIKSPIRLFAKFTNNIEYLVKLLGVNEFLPQSTVLKWLSKHACEINHYEEAICENSIFVLCGHDTKQFNKTLLPVILGHDPAGASTKTLIHYAQEIHANGRFQQFDYGAARNFLQYGTMQPPEYPVHKITLPIALFSAENDWLASDVDVTSLYVQLANPIEHYVVPMKEFNHIDFLWAIDAPKLVYSKLMHLLEDDGVQDNIINSITNRMYVRLT